ncbi:MAG: hypothetical protein WCQ50_14370 [Spirochaetota bacterium]
MIRPAALAIASLVTIATITALPLRFITSLSYDDWGLVYPGDAVASGLQFGEVAIVKVSDSLSLLGNASLDGKTSLAPAFGGGAGFALVLAPGWYIDSIYSAKYYLAAGSLTNDVQASLNYENAFLYAGLRERLVMDKNSLTIFNSLFAKYALLAKASLWISYTLLYENGIGLDQALWTYLEVNPAPLFGFTLGLAASSFHFANPISTRLQGLGASAILGLAFHPLETLTLKAQFEHFAGDRDWNRNSLGFVADLSLP